jgi:hypothetical protein
VDYFRVRTSASRCIIIFGCQADSDPGLLFDYLSTDMACRLFERHVNDIQDSRGGNPISSSRSWALPSRENTGWDLVAVGPTPEQVKRTAELFKVACRTLTVAGEPMMVCHGDTLAVDGLCAAIEALAENSCTIEGTRTERFDADADCLLAWRGFPDEEPDPYRVGMVT